MNGFAPALKRAASYAALLCLVALTLPAAGQQANGLLQEFGSALVANLPGQAVQPALAATPEIWLQRTGIVGVGAMHRQSV